MASLLATTLNDKPSMGINGQQLYSISPSVQIFPWTSGSLTNGGEDIILVDAGLNEVFNIDYDDVSPWPSGRAGREEMGRRSRSLIQMPRPPTRLLTGGRAVPRVEVPATLCPSPSRRQRSLAVLRSSSCPAVGGRNSGPAHRHATTCRYHLREDTPGRPRTGPWRPALTFGLGQGVVTQPGGLNGPRPAAAHGCPAKRSAMD